MTGGSAKTVAARLLERMKASGVDYLFGNAGTDFPPVIEAFAGAAKAGLALPEPVLVAHETTAIGMAHGYHMATGRAQCAMFHVNVGLANAVMGVINAATDNAPVLVCSGRTPITERGRPGSRSRPIHWGQEMRDQAAMVREVTKWDYELRYPEQAELVVDRALAVANSDPAGPVYLSLPREVLAETVPDEPPLTTRQQAVRAGPPRAEAVAAAVALLKAAKNPVLIAQKPPAPGDWSAIERLAELFALPVVDFWAFRNVIATDHPMHAGGDPLPWLDEADVVVTVETMVPWLIDRKNSGWDARIVALGVDPLHQKVPMRSFPVDVALAGDVGLALDALAEGLRPAVDDLAGAIAERRTRVTARGEERRAAARQRAEKGNAAPMSKAWVSHCLSEARAENGAVFSELGCDPSVMTFRRPDTFFTAPNSGGLGWGVPAALGYQLADRERQVIACIGDGSFVFANPVSCLMVARAQALPVLIVVFNNGIWQAVKRATLAMYPDGEAAHANAMPFTQLAPSPDYGALARAHDCFGERVEDGAALPAAIERALAATRQGVPALLDVIVGEG